MKQVFLLCLVFLSLIGITGCASNQKSDTLTITSGNQNIKYSTYDESYLDNKDIFKPFFEQNKDILYLTPEEKIELDFGNNQPDSITIRDALLSKNGDIMYGDKPLSSVQVQYTKEKNNYTFTVNTNAAALLSSSLNTTSYRGFKVVADYGKEKAVIAFVINSDSYPFKQ